MESALSSALMVVPPSLTSQQLGNDTVVDAQRDDGYGKGRPPHRQRVRLSGGRKRRRQQQRWFLPSRTTRQRTTARGPTAHPMTPVMAVPGGSSAGHIPHERPGQDAATARGRAPNV